MFVVLRSVNLRGFYLAWLLAVWSEYNFARRCVFGVRVIDLGNFNVFSGVSDVRFSASGFARFTVMCSVGGVAS